MLARRSACLLVAVVASLSTTPVGATAEQKKPRTGFEERNGESWTTFDEEIKFLDAVDDKSPRVAIDVIGKSLQDRPLHLVQVGHPAPRTEAEARREPTILFVCTQHGNEPAGREACLQLLRDLAFADDAELLRQLSSSTILFIPTANPDGREANTRGNADGVDINRDHLNLTTPEARAVAAVVRDWQPDAVLDLHEYGPSLPAIYDDEVLYLWPRNLNTDQDVHDLAKTLAEEYIAKGAEEHGYTADEYGQYAVGDQNVYQSAGDADEGIARNAMGLRHSLGILIETAVSAEPRNGPDEVTTEAAVMRRRVASHLVVSLEALEFMREQGKRAMRVAAQAALRKAKEGRLRSAPVYFGGADNDPPEASEIQDPPPCAYELTQQQASEVRTALALHAITFRRAGNKTIVPMGQSAEPVIPLLLDERGARHAVAATPLMKC